MKNSICLIIPFMGEEFPEYFQYFLKTLSWNPTVDFKIFSNIPRLPLDDKREFRNVHYHHFSLEEFEELATSKLGIPVSIKSAYKLCDFKPTYGLLFEDYLKDYQFWGHCDVDVLFGDIRKFITNDKLEAYDILSIREEYLSGFFTLYRNESRVNMLFKKSEDWKYILSSDAHFCFDECNFRYYECFEGIPISRIESDIESMTHVVYKERETIRTSFETICHEFLQIKRDENEYLDEIVVTEYGVIGKKSGYEYILVHLISLKKFDFFHYQKIDFDDQSISLDSFGISNSQKSIVHRKNVIMGMKLCMNTEKWHVSKNRKSIYNSVLGHDYVLHGTDRLILNFHNAVLTGEELTKIVQDSNIFGHASKSLLRDIVIHIISKGLVLECLKIMDLDTYKINLSRSLEAI